MARPLSPLPLFYRICCTSSIALSTPSNLNYSFAKQTLNQPTNLRDDCDCDCDCDCDMSYYNQPPPVGAPPPQGYGKDGYPPPGYPAQGYEQSYPQQAYPAQGYPPPYAQPPPRQQSSGPSFMEGCLAALCCCCLLDACF